MQASPDGRPQAKSFLFLDSLLAQQDVFVLDLDQPYGNAGCILMASGQGRRFGENKLLTDLAGKPLIQWALDTSAGLFTHAWL